MTKAEAFISIATLREFLDLDRVTGRLIWRAREPRHFTATEARTAEHQCNNWNSQFAGTPALECVDASGHLTGRIKRRMVYAHRAVFALAHGRWPALSIDHINGNPADNRPLNLRDVSHQENHRNTKLFKQGRSGVVGVSFAASRGQWRAHITVDGKFKHLGFHAEKGAAIAARKSAETTHKFHPNHGRTAS